MHTIEVDDDVFSVLQKHARPFVDTPNSTLRRLLEIDPLEKPSVVMKTETEEQTDELSLEELFRHIPPRGKAPKTDLKLLVRSGLLCDGENLFLVDYQKNVIQQFNAVISGDELMFRGKPYSMSELARILLKQIGYTSDSVRGPAHWANSNGVTVKDLWEQYLRSQY